MKLLKLRCVLFLWLVNVFNSFSIGSCEFIWESVCVCLTVRLTGLKIRYKARSQSTLIPPHTRTQAKISKTETLYVLPLYCEMEAGINMHTCVCVCKSVSQFWGHTTAHILSQDTVCVWVHVCVLHFCTALLLFGLRAVTSDERTHTFLQCLCLYVTGPSFFVQFFLSFF